MAVGVLPDDIGITVGMFTELGLEGEGVGVDVDSTTAVEVEDGRFTLDQGEYGVYTYITAIIPQLTSAATNHAFGCPEWLFSSITATITLTRDPKVRTAAITEVTIFI